MRRVSLASRSLTAVSSNQALITSAVLAALAVPAAAQLQFEELPRMGLPVDANLTFAVALGDVDGDGDLDLVVANSGSPPFPGASPNQLYLNDGNGTFTDATAMQMPGGAAEAVALGDVDGDGDLDIVFGCYSWQNQLNLNDGSGTFSDATASQMPVDTDLTRSVALGDVDGDGDLDLVLGNGDVSYGQQNRLYLNDGSGTFTDVTVSQMPVDTDQTYAVALGDVDGDGDLDLVVGNSTPIGVQNRLYLNNGSGTFTDATAARLPVVNDRTRSVALGDVDGDGDLDLVVGNLGYQVVGQNRLYLNNGTGTFTDATATQMPVDGDATSSVALGDVDGDGDLDLVLGNGGAQPHLYLNDGSGTFTDVTALRVPVTVGVGNQSIALGDVDGDGDLDLLVGISGVCVSAPWCFPLPNLLYLNLQRQLHAPTAPQIGQPYDLDAYMRYGTSNVANFSVAYLSTAPASVASVFGTIGIDLAAAAPFPTLIVPQPTGVGSVGFTVPNMPSLVGQAIYSQSMLVAYPYDLRLSNVVADVIQ